MFKNYFEHCSRSRRQHAIMVNTQELSERRVALREALVASAQRIISQRGYQALRARDVTQDVGCALGAIYNVFPDLDALILAVKDRTLDMLEGEIAKKIPPGKRLPGNGASPAQAAEKNLQELARLYLAFASEHPKLWQAIFEHRSPDSIVPDGYMAKLDGVLRYVERPFEVLAPHLTPSDRKLWARALFSGVHGIVALGLDQKLGPLSADSLKWQVYALIHAAAIGVSSNVNPQPA
jgi:AcrR family transcriptional regulator